MRVILCYSFVLILSPCSGISDSFSLLHFADYVSSVSRWLFVLSCRFVACRVFVRQVHSQALLTAQPAPPGSSATLPLGPSGTFLSLPLSFSLYIDFLSFIRRAAMASTPLAAATRPVSIAPPVLTASLPQHRRCRVLVAPTASRARRNALAARPATYVSTSPRCLALAVCSYVFFLICRRVLLRARCRLRVLAALIAQAMLHRARRARLAMLARLQPAPRQWLSVLPARTRSVTKAAAPCVPRAFSARLPIVVMQACGVGYYSAGAQVCDCCLLFVVLFCCFGLCFCVSCGRTTARCARLAGSARMPLHSQPTVWLALTLLVRFSSSFLFIRP